MDKSYPHIAAEIKENRGKMTGIEVFGRAKSVKMGKINVKMGKM